MNPKTNGKLVDYEATIISPNTSFLEMLDVVNEQLVERGEEPIAFDSDCREGICGACSLTINGEAHGPDHPSAVCELYMRRFKDGDTICVEPFRAKAFPIIKDLVVDRSALDRVVQAGGFISARTGSAPEANSILVPKKKCRSGHGSSSLHWLRRLCGTVSKCFRDVIYRRKGFAPCIPAPRRAGTPSPGPEHGSRYGRRRLRELHKHLRMRRGLSG
jgi:ferredoxin